MQKRNKKSFLFSFGAFIVREFLFLRWDWAFDAKHRLFWLKTLYFSINNRQGKTFLLSPPQLFHSPSPPPFFRRSRPLRNLINSCSLINSYKLLNQSFSVLPFFRFKLTTTKFAVIVKRAAQGSIYRVYVCHQTRRLRQWDSTPSSERRRRGFATATASSSTHRETVFRSVRSAATHRRAATTTWTSTRRLRWPLQVSAMTFAARAFSPRPDIISLESSDFAWTNKQNRTLD